MEVLPFLVQASYIAGRHSTKYTEEKLPSEPIGAHATSANIMALCQVAKQHFHQPAS